MFAACTEKLWTQDDPRNFIIKLWICYSTASSDEAAKLRENLIFITFRRWCWEKRDEREYAEWKGNFKMIIMRSASRDYDSSSLLSFAVIVEFNFIFGA